jgi:hypothetical protein
MKLGILRSMVFAGATMGLVAAAEAGFTTVSKNAGEATHEQLFEHIYGGDFVADGLNFTNGVITAIRVQDYLPGPDGVMDMTNGAADSAADQIWMNGKFTATAEARYANFEQAFGYVLGSSGGSFTKLFDVSGSGFNVSGSTTMAIDLLGETFRWARGGDNGIFTSKDGDNKDDLDHMVTYKIEGLNDGTVTWLLFWEDLNKNFWQNEGWLSRDGDFNDLVVEVKATAIPLPAAALPAAGMLVALGVVKKLRRRRTA